MANQARQGFSPTGAQGEAMGGILGTLAVLPKAMAFGALVFSPLGMDYVPVGIFAGLTASAIANVIGGISGGVRIMVLSPFSLTTIMLMTTLSQILAQLHYQPGQTAVAGVALAHLFFVVLLAGLIQALFGLLGIGAVTKYMPYPVLAGLMNGAAILIILSQLGDFLGISIKEGWAFSHLQPASLAVGIATLGIIWLSRGRSRFFPAPILGILGGSLLYYLLSAIGFGESLGPRLGSIPSGLPTLSQGRSLLAILLSPNAHLIVQQLLAPALAIAAVASLRTLMVGITADHLTETRSDANRELLAQGLGNALAALCGGITIAGGGSGTYAIFQAGGRKGWARGLTGVILLLVMSFLGPLASAIPKTVIAAMLISIAITSFDRWSLALLRQIRGEQGRRREESFLNFTVILLVTVILVMQGIFEALLVGVGVSVLLFILRMGKQVLRREYGVDKIRSNAQRADEENDILSQQGGIIRVLELEGALFFGTADQVVELVEARFAAGAECVILDLKRVTDVDSTAANIIRQLKQKWKRRNRRLLLSSADFSSGSVGELAQFLSPQEIRDDCFSITEDAIALAEDRLLDRTLGITRYDREIPLSKVNILQGVPDHELALMDNYMTRNTYQDGEILFQQGDVDRRMFLIVRGRALIYLLLPSGTPQRLGILCPGTLFGEMAVLDGGVRSATVVAEGEMTCYTLSRDSLDAMGREMPALAQRLLTGISIVLSGRIRTTNTMLAHMKM